MSCYVDTVPHHVMPHHATSCGAPVRYAYPIKCTEAIRGADGQTVVELRAEVDKQKSSKPKVRADGV